VEHPPAIRPILNITGERVALGPLRRDLIPSYCAWHNDLAVSSTLGLSWPETLEQATASYERHVADAATVRFTVYELATLRPIGVAHLYEIALRHGRASFGIIIGADDARGRGYGTEATRLTLDYAFTALGLSNVMLTAFAFNAGGLRAYANAGFREFGRRRRCSRQGDRLWDLVYMECLADEFVSPVLARVFAPDE
jgi:RimJ/RimL family protein N-acetyltransferase